MFRPSSLVRDYTLISQHDPALQLPDDAEQRTHALKVARDQSDWASLLRAGQSPTMFLCRQVSGTALDWWHDQEGGDMYKQTLLLRLAIKSIDNLGVDAKYDTEGGHKKLSLETLDLIYAIETDEDPRLGRKIVAELSGLVAARTFRGLVPLSNGG